jgi:arylsulfatase A
VNEIIHPSPSAGMLRQSIMSRLLFLLGLAFTSSVAAQAADRKPNIVLILIDDFGYECITANGGQSYQTPNVDKLAASGIRFEQCQVQPLCTPTRVQLMTGRYNIRNHLNFDTLPRQETTFRHLLKSARYAPGICCK